MAPLEQDFVATEIEIGAVSGEIDWQPPSKGDWAVAVTARAR
jgi:hypothetical protein